MTRGDTLNVIMRGYEKEVYDITDLPHSRPTITKRLLRNLWSNAVEDIEDSDEDDNDNTRYYSGTLALSENGITCSYTFVNGLLITEQHHMTSWDYVDSSKKHITNYDSKQTITYKYKSFNTNTGLPQNINPIIIKYTLPDKIEIANDNENKLDWYLTIKEEKSIDSQWNSDRTDRSRKENISTTNYDYKILNGDGIYLTREETITEIKEYEYQNISGSYFGEMSLINEEVQNQTTLHFPMGNGFYSTMTYQDGAPTGSTISQGKPSQQVSQYTIQQVQNVFLNTVDLNKKDNEIRNYDDRKKLAAIVNTSFPIVEEDIKNACVEAMYWLNRRIEETISIDIFSEIINGIPQIDHVVDFTERIKYEGNEYFLVSNKLDLTPTQYIQHLTLIRWH